jgi:16S rRNA (uracil1498-N3)-methyltransferase
MGIPRFYVEQLAGPSVRLSDREAAHAVRARRLAVGDEIAIFDGQGHQTIARLSAVTRSIVEATVGEITIRPRPTPALSLAVALPKGPRQDVLIEKCTELGVAALIPLITERSISGASDHKLDRWRQIAIEAAKQSAQAWLPQFFPPEPLAQALARIPTHDQAVVAATEAAATIKTGTQLVSAPASVAAGLCTGRVPHLFRDGGAKIPLEMVPNPKSLLAFIGPEGGWTNAELSLMISQNCHPITLGPNILRVETAAIAIAAIVHQAQTSLEPDGASPPNLKPET